jgi:hypothetical protein
MPFRVYRNYGTHQSIHRATFPAALAIENG